MRPMRRTLHFVVFLRILPQSPSELLGSTAECIISAERIAARLENPLLTYAPQDIAVTKNLGQILVSVGALAP